MIGGQLAPLVHYLEAARGDPERWNLIEPGWEWPHEGLAAAIDTRLAAGVPVYVETAPIAWYGTRMQQDYTDWQRVASRYRTAPVTATLLRVWLDEREEPR